MKSVLLSATALSVALVAGAAQAQTEITLWHAMGGQLGETVDAMVASYNESQSDVVVTPVYRGSYEETLTAGVAAFRAGEAPHIIQVFDAGAATIINAGGAAMPVADLLTQYGVDFDANDYIEGIRNFYADADGKMIGMPFNSSTPVLYYNKDVLDAAGVTPPVTWEEFESVTAPALMDAGIIPLAQSHLPWIMSENFHSRHNLPLSDELNGFSGVPTEIYYNNPSLIFHFEKLKEWFDAGAFGYYGASWSDNQNEFAAGNVAMWLGSSASFGGLRATAEFDFGTTHLPYWEQIAQEGFGTFIGGAALFALSGFSDEEYEGVANFFEYLASAETQYFWHKETGYVPITNAAYDLAKEDGYYEESPDAEVGTLQLMQQGGRYTAGYRLGFYVQIREVMNREYDRIFAGDVSVPDAFETIEEEANELLDRFARTVQ